MYQRVGKIPTRYDVALTLDQGGKEERWISPLRSRPLASRPNTDDLPIAARRSSIATHDKMQRGEFGMIGTRNWKLVLAILAALGVGSAMQAWAHGPGDELGGPGPHGGPPPYGVMHFGQLVEQLIFPCRNDCVQAERSCTETAESDALTCATQTCNATIDSARTDCAGSRTSQACLTDVSALITCVEPCTTTESAAIKTCATTFKACVGACSPTPTPTP